MLSVSILPAHKLRSLFKPGIAELHEVFFRYANLAESIPHGRPGALAYHEVFNVGRFNQFNANRMCASGFFAIFRGQDACCQPSGGTTTYNYNTVRHFPVS